MQTTHPGIVTPETDVTELVDRLSLNKFELDIQDEAQYKEVGEYLRKVKQLAKELEAKRKVEVEPHLNAQRQVQARYKPLLDKLDNTARLINRAMTEWTVREQRRKEEERRHLEAIARQEEEARRKVLEERAKRWEAKGNDAKAEALRQEAEETVIPTPTVETKVEQAEGQHIRTVWKGRVVDVKKIPYEYLLAFSEVVQSKIDKFASSTKGAIPVAGIDFYEEKMVVTKTK